MDPSDEEDLLLARSSHLSEDEKALRKRYWRMLRTVPDERYSPADHAERYATHERALKALVGLRPEEASPQDDRLDEGQRAASRERFHKAAGKERMYLFADKVEGRVRSADRGSGMEARVLRGLHFSESPRAGVISTSRGGSSPRDGAMWSPR